MDRGSFKTKKVLKERPWIYVKKNQQIIICKDLLIFLQEPLSKVTDF
jgi:chemotaxis methyl-accepting protein methylase